MKQTKGKKRLFDPIGRGCVSIGMLLIAVLSMGCASCSGKAGGTGFEPAAGGDWDISTPEAEGLDRELVERLYANASNVETVRAVLVIKNGKLIAEKYFNDGSIDRRDTIQSVTKSFTGALTGIAVEQGLLEGLDQPIVDFFPELRTSIDPRKQLITIRHLLQMRAGYPWEEASPEGMELLLHEGFRPRHMADVPLVREPGSGFDYSNLSSHALAIIIARAADRDLLLYARENLFEPLGIEPGEWRKSWEDYRMGFGELQVTPRDMAKLGQLYMNGGRWNGEQIVPEDYVEASLSSYTEDAWYYRIGRNVRHTGYGYQWWSAQAGKGRYNFAWGHGGQQIALIKEHDMVVVVAADPLYLQHGAKPWRYEKENLNLVGDFVAALPGF